MGKARFGHRCKETQPPEDIPIHESNLYPGKNLYHLDSNKLDHGLHTIFIYFDTT